MELRDLIARVGEEQFAAACAWAWETAAGTGIGLADDVTSPHLAAAADVPHDLELLLWSEGDAPWLERVALAFELYRRMPCYATLMYTTGHFPSWDARTRRAFWAEYRTLVSDPDDRLADPVAYSLWCDYFEDLATVDEAWREVARPELLSERGLERVLDVSGPVPFPLKARLYDRLVADVRRHESIFKSLLHSAFDVYGSLDGKAARELLAQLSLPRETPGLAELRQKIGLPR